MRSHSCRGKKNAAGCMQAILSVYKNLNHKFPCSSSPYIQNRPNRVCEFCLVYMYIYINILPLSKWCETSILVGINYLPISKYVHIVKPNVLRLNKDFFLSFFSPPTADASVINFVELDGVFLGNKEKRSKKFFFTTLINWQ